eukprot:3568683-Rhodomonas_salina.5
MPMDLGTMSAKVGPSAIRVSTDSGVRDGGYKSMEELGMDFLLVCANATMILSERMRVPVQRPSDAVPQGGHRAASEGPAGAKSKAIARRMVVRSAYMSGTNSAYGGRLVCGAMFGTRTAYRAAICLCNPQYSPAATKWHAGTEPLFKALVYSDQAHV